MKNFSGIGVQISDILLPKSRVDLQKWAVIACDQFTSQPDYWDKVNKIVGNAPSTLRMILPEVHLGTPDEPELINNANKTMLQYSETGLFQKHEGLILVERQVGSHTRHGLMLSLDLEKYDFHKGSQSIIRATEGTILGRLPPRIRIRENAPLEIPHILVLIDDPHNSVIEPLFSNKDRLTQLYDFDLMLGSGHISGYLINGQTDQDRVMHALEHLANPQEFHSKYGVDSTRDVLLFAVGDGNHSLATAKSCWEKIKGQVGLDHPARYALVEIENVHDRGLTFEPIHRVIFRIDGNLQPWMGEFFGGDVSIRPVPSAADMKNIVDSQKGPDHLIGLITHNQFGIISIGKPRFNLPVGSIQAFLDHLTQKTECKVDYLHGFDVTCQLGSQPGNAGFYLPVMEKTALFKTVILDGALPRKTFSMGEAVEKRFYLECRRIRVD